MAASVHFMGLRGSGSARTGDKADEAVGRGRPEARPGEAFFPNRKAWLLFSAASANDEAEERKATNATMKASGLACMVYETVLGFLQVCGYTVCLKF